MDTKALVTEEIGAGAAFLRQLNEYYPVKADCWLIEPEEERYLYVALEGLTDDKFGNACGGMLRIRQSMTDYSLDLFRVKQIKTSNSVAKCVIEIYGRFPGSYSRQVRRRRVRGESR
jgi:hypothetical protein